MGFLAGSPVLAATFSVDSTADAVDAVPGNGLCATAIGACTLRAAIQEANALDGIDVITVPAGTYVLSLQGTDEDASATGDLDITSAIVINGAGALATIVDANSQDRVVELHAKSSLTISDATIQGGVAHGGLDFGGTIRDAGGGILAHHSSLVLTRVVVRNNASAIGGGLLAHGDMSVLSSTTISQSTITQNHSVGSGGGMALISMGIASILDTTVSANTAGESGGGLGMIKGDPFPGVPTVTINRSTISGNHAAVAAGGIAVSGGLEIANSTLSGNSSAGAGGALVHGEFGSAILRNVTITNNASGLAGAVVNEWCAECQSSLLLAQNTIIANNSGTASSNCAGDPLTDTGHNLEFPGHTCAFVSNAVHADPLLGMLTNNGGPTQTHALNSHSPAIDAGANTICAAPPVSRVDQRGEPRPSVAHCDIGAFELEQADALAADLAMDFGAAGLWALYNGTTFNLLAISSPDELATGRFSTDGRVDLVADFPGVGVWLWRDSLGWRQLHWSNASAIATGDLDGNGLDEALMVFPGFGLWVFTTNHGALYVSDAYQLHAQDPNRVATGDLDGNGQTDVILNFPGQGLWVWENNTTWRQLHQADAAAVVIGDLDGGGRADLLADFPGFGLWVYTNNNGWFRLHTTDATVMTAGDIDGSGQADAVISFPGAGIWAWMNSSEFKRLHTADAAILRMADIDGSGRDDVIISFPGAGIWAWMNDTNWIQLHDLNPQDVTAGNLDGN
jgi:CSLREA domain-containing protein